MSDRKPARKEIARDQRRRDEERTVWPDRSAALIDQQARERNRGAEDQVSCRDREPAGKAKAEHAAEEHRGGDPDQRLRISCIRVRQDERRDDQSARD